MIRFHIKRDELLKPLQMVSNVPEKRQTLPILSHLLLTVSATRLSVKGTDLEIGIEAYADLIPGGIEEGAVTLPGRKLLDICRNLPAEATLEFIEESNRCLIRSGGSQFSLATLPANSFPSFDEKNQHDVEIILPQKELLRLIQSTSFAIAQRDFRHYLNGMLLEVSQDALTFVATDGHRLALNRRDQTINIQKKMSVIVPRKGVIELTRLLSNPSGEDATVKLLISAQHVTLEGANFKFVSRLIEGQFPNYDHVIPKKGDKQFQLDKQVLKQALIRASILSNERLPGISMQLRKNSLCLLARNPEKEEAKEEISMDYAGEEVTVSFNAAYLIDVLNVLYSDEVVLTFFNSSSAFLVKGGIETPGWVSLFVIMPMRL